MGPWPRPPSCRCSLAGGARDMAAGAEASVEPKVWQVVLAFAIYGTLNLFINFFNKWAMAPSGAGFGLPVFYSTWHMLMSIIGSLVLMLVNKPESGMVSFAHLNVQVGDANAGLLHHGEHLVQQRELDAHRTLRQPGYQGAVAYARDVHVLLCLEEAIWRDDNCFGHLYRHWCHDGRALQGPFGDCAWNRARGHSDGGFVSEAGGRRAADDEFR